jgi:diguanylate cyclase (GGDEF)-like protein
VRREIQIGMVARQETIATTAGCRLRDYFANVTSKLRLIGKLAARSGRPAVRRETLEQIVYYDVDRNYVAGVYVVGADFVGGETPQHVFAIDDAMRSGGRRESAATPSGEESAEVVRHIEHYRRRPDAAWHISGSLLLAIGSNGQVVSVPMHDGEGRFVGLVAALIPTAFAAEHLERSAGDDGRGLWILTADGWLLGGREGAVPAAHEVSRVAALGKLTTQETENWMMTVAPVTLADGRPWTLAAAVPRYKFHQDVEARVGGPWTRRLLTTVALGNFLGLCVLLSLRHWREQVTVFRAQAEHDTLTGVYSRRFLDREAAILCRKVRRLGVIMIDLNDFKRHNDTLGHYAGDQMLRATADLVKNVIRDEDFVVRLGGDEFLVLLPMADDGLLASVESRVREAVEHWNLDRHLPGACLTLAIGAASGPSRYLDRLIKQADDRMYADKAMFKKEQLMAAMA